MKRIVLLILTLFAAYATHAQTVENIRVVQEGENNLKITYRIGASTSAQIFNVYMTCSMDGGRRFEPKAVMGDVGQNIVGGKSIYTIIWDVFADVEEVNNPNFFFRLETVEDNTPVPVPVQTQPREEVKEPTREAEPERVIEEPKGEPKQEPKQDQEQEDPFQQGFGEEKKKDKFERDAFFCYSGNLGMGIPVGISFGSLRNWGYYVTPLRFGLDNYYIVDPTWGYTEKDYLLHLMAGAGVTKHLFSAGFYRMHAYAGLGLHLSVEDLTSESRARIGVMPEAGIVNVLWRFNINAGLAYSSNYFPERTYASSFNFVMGVGFVF